MKSRAVISLGSNISPQENIERAIEAIKARFGFVAQSSFITTAPLGPVVQPDFLNGVVVVDAVEDIEEFKRILKGIECLVGRQPREKWGPREIDLDVLAWNGEIVDQDYYQRDFLRASLQEVMSVVKVRCY